jgi:hypothetical protein
VEHQLWRAILAELKAIDKRPRRTNEDYSDEDIVKTWFWAVLHDRPVLWACRRENWPVYERHRPRPSPSTMSRRFRHPAVRRLLEELERRVLRPLGLGSLVWALDGKPLAISGCTKDRQAGYGRAAGGKAKGYKMHALVSPEGAVAAWRVAPMNKDEREMGRRLLARAEVKGYVLADSNYDSNPLHGLCGRRGDLQLVAPPRYGFCTGRGHRRQTPGRLRSIALLSNPQSPFGRELHKERDRIERYYGNLTNWGGGLVCLPPWVRTHRRVHRWVQAKLILSALRRRIRSTTYVA